VLLATVAVVALVPLGSWVAHGRGGSDGAMRRIVLPVAGGGAADEATLAATIPSEPVNILLIGSDERGPEDAAEGVTGRRSDTIALIRVEPDTGRISLLSIPRDLWVTVADTGAPGKVNGAFGGDGGGPDRLIRTLRANLGIPVQRYAQVDFEGFQALVDLVGGVDVTFEGPTRDQATGFEIAGAGVAHLDGSAALRYARSRHLETFLDGAWQADPTADLGRIHRQQELLRALATRVAETSGDDPGALDDLLLAMGSHLTLDAQFPVLELLGLVKAYIDTDPAAVPMEVLPTVLDRVGQQSVLRLDVERATSVLLAYGAVAPPSVPGTGPS
jgi:LCP family protein required for cell wall assembly